ncbi:MAG: choice-of-anchor X domain-containing protein, partial [Candidatus Eremiobacterota bacterium]
MQVHQNGFHYARPLSATSVEPSPAAPEPEAPPQRETFRFTFDTGGRADIRNVRMKGSFDPVTGAYDPGWNQGRPIPMRDDGQGGDEKAGDGIYTASVELVTNGKQKAFEWGVIGDVSGAREKWLPLQDGNLGFMVDGPERTINYSPIQNHLMGVHRRGGDGISFRTWAPVMGSGIFKDYHLEVEIFEPDGRLRERQRMTRENGTGCWQYSRPTGWQDLEGLPYRYVARHENGRSLKMGDQEVAYSDPYARFVQGQQRGVERIYVDPVLGIETGWYDDSNKGGPNYSDNPTWGRFTVDDRPDAERVQLILKDYQGRPMTREQLLDRLGEPRLVPYEEAPPKDRRDVDILRSWGIDADGKVTRYQWTNSVEEDGAINLTKVGNAWVATVNNFERLKGMHYEFRVFEGGRLVGDRNGDGELQPPERLATPFNDPVTDRISGRPGAERLSLIRESRFQFQHQNAPRKTTDPARFTIYEMHVGSFMGSKDNANPSNFKDLIEHLDYLDELGVNTLELMPTSEFGGKRDWGYTPDFYFAGAQAYGFEMDAQQALQRGLCTEKEAEGKETVWVHGTDAIKLFVDEAHKRGFNIMGDVVYNHASGKADADNPLWAIDGSDRSFFKWFGKYLSYSDWGAKPNFAAPGVKQFFVDNAVQQLEELGFDGIRFDFTQVLHDTGSTAERWEGMQTLRMLNRAIDMVRPGAYTVAEDFSRSWLVAADYDKSEWQGEAEWRMEKRGMGFDAVWNDRFHDDMIGALEGTDPKFTMDRLMEALTAHVDVQHWGKAVVYTHSHDEVGNSGQWAARMAARSQETAETMKPFPRAMARTAAGITLTAAGVPMLFQGEEFLDNADYKHGVTSTWGNDLRWLEMKLDPAQLDQIKAGHGDPEAVKRWKEMTPQQRELAEQLALKRGHFNWYKELTRLRASSSALTATSEIARYWTHNEERTLAFRRKSGSEEFLVASNFSRDGRSVPLPEGRWQV